VRHAGSAPSPREIVTCQQIKFSWMLVPSPQYCASFTSNAGVELIRAAKNVFSERRSQGQSAERCWARQAVVAISVAGSSRQETGKRIMSWRGARAANTQWITIFRLIRSATSTDGIMAPRSFSGFLNSASGSEPKSRKESQSVGRLAKNSAKKKMAARGAANPFEDSCLIQSSPLPENVTACGVKHDGVGIGVGLDRLDQL
jgi:hypothetical protein